MGQGRVLTPLKSAIVQHFQTMEFCNTAQVRGWQLGRQSNASIKGSRVKV